MKPNRRGKRPDRVEYGADQELKFPQFVLFFVGMPVKLRQSVIHITPWMTWAITSTIAVVSVVVWYTEPGHELFEWLAFRPEASGLRWWTGLLGHGLVHGDWLHLLGNLYFLVLFGRNIECCFGRRRLFGLFLVSVVLGGLLHGLVTGHGLIGASGGVFGILVFYVCQYPHARVIWIPFGWIARLAMMVWARGFLRKGFPVTIYFAIFGTLQLLVLYDQLFMEGQVSALAHLGGGAAGALIWLAWRFDWLP
jgi:membrane associated rhomboid family serine protease